jgi:hypothetical protein
MRGASHEEKRTALHFKKTIETKEKRERVTQKKKYAAAAVVHDARH